MSKIISIPTPENFSFLNTVNSHGWCELLPFVKDDQKQTLSFVFTDQKSANHYQAVVSETDRQLKIEVFSELFDREKLVRDVRHIFRLDDDLTEFYRIVSREKRLKWIAEANAGRMLRSPTVYEDLVKTICTTNCSWALTRKMTANLVAHLGEPAAGGAQAFPTAEQMAEVSDDFYRTEIRAGYRAPYFAELAEKVAGGKLDPESWLDPDLSGKELKKQMESVKGVGDYAAENLLKLVGNYEGLALDSWVRAQFYRQHNRGESCEDRQITEFYEKFGVWRGLAAWCDVTEKWFKTENSST